MKIIKTISCVVTLLALLLTTACGSSPYKDGTYFAAAPDFPNSGWKETVEIKIEGGKIVDINWDAVYKDNSIPIHKKQYSKSGLYGMLAGGANNEWYDQASAAEIFVIEHGIDALNMADDGTTDAIASCSIHVNTLEALYNECLEQAKK